MNELQPASEMNWLEKAIERGADAQTLDKLIELKNKMEDRLARQAFAVAMNACQKEMPRVVKDAHNKHTDTRYVYLETLQDAIGPIYLKHGFSVTWSQAESPNGLTRVVATLWHVGGHSERYQGDYPIDGEGAKGGRSMNALQGTVSAHTYAQRDMTRLMWNITIAGKDKDGNQDNGGLTAEEMTELNTLIEELQGKKVLTRNPQRLFEWLSDVSGIANLESLDQLPRSTFKPIIVGLKALDRKGTK